MPPAISPEGKDRPTAWTWAEAAWDSIRRHLEGEKRRVQEEIKGYPRPIPACDLQFNHLLEERASLSRELDRLDEAAADGLRCPDPVTPLDAFVRSSRHLDDGAKRRLTARRAEGLPERPA
jgi:hypothetical protein